MGYIITQHVLNSGKRLERTEEETKKFPFAFRIYDGDGVLYFRGYSKIIGHDALDDLQNSYGATEIHYKTDLGWEEV